MKIYSIVVVDLQIISTSQLLTPIVFAKKAKNENGGLIYI